MSGNIYEHPATTSEAVQQFYFRVQSALHADVMFCSEDRSVMLGAHKIVVSMQSPVLADLLYESKGVKYVEVKGVNESAISNMISCFYDRDITIASITDLKDTLTLAKRYQLSSLEKKCLSKLVDFPVDASNVLSVLETSLSIKNEAKMQECLTIVRNNKDTILSNENFLSTKIENALEILENLKRSDVISKAEVFCSVLRWRLYNKDMNSGEFVPEIVNRLNLSALEFRELISYFRNFLQEEISRICNARRMQGPERLANPETISSPIMTICNDLIHAVQNDTQGEVLSSVCGTEYTETTQVYSDLIEFFNTENRTGRQTCDSGNNTERFSCTIGTNTDLETQEDAYLQKPESGRETCNSGNTTVSFSCSIGTNTDLETQEDEYLEKPETGSEACNSRNTTVSFSCSIGTNTDLETQEDGYLAKPETGTEPCASGNTTVSFSCNIGTNTDFETEEDEYFEKELYPGKIKHLKLAKVTDGPNEYNWVDRVKITILDDLGRRDIKIPLEVNENGALKRMFDEKDEHNFYDANISYIGLLHYFKSEEPKKSLPTPTERVEVLKTALFFEDRKVFDENIAVLRNILEFDPVFLDGLRSISDLEGRCVDILRSNTTNILLHPNFLKSSWKLIDLLLQQDKLHLWDESCLLKGAITWLESPINQRWRLRTSVLKKIAFEKISESNFRNIANCYTDFFSPQEVQSICAYKTAVGDESLLLRKDLPAWYSFKSREVLSYDL